MQVSFCLISGNNSGLAPLRFGQATQEPTAGTSVASAVSKADRQLDGLGIVECTPLGYALLFGGDRQRRTVALLREWGAAE
jgi:hypothetical protein